MAEDPTLSSAVDVDGAPISDPGCMPDVAPPKKRALWKKKAFLDLLQGSDTQGAQTPNAATSSQKPARKTPGRKKKPLAVSQPDTVQCHGQQGPVSMINPVCDMPEPVPVCCEQGTTRHFSDGSPEIGGTDVCFSHGLPPLLSVLCDTADALREEIADQVQRHGQDTSNDNAGDVSRTAVEDNLTQEACKTLPRLKIKRDSKKRWENSIKRGCQAQFTVKTLLYLPQVSEICIIQEKHINRDGLVVHGGMKYGDRSAFSAHLSPKIRSFVEACLRRGDSPNQIMKKHLELLKQYKAEGKDITRDLFSLPKTFAISQEIGSRNVHATQKRRTKCQDVGTEKS